MGLALGHMTPTDESPLALLLFILVYPVLEECVFRGMIQPFIQRHWRAHWQLSPRWRLLLWSKNKPALSAGNLITSGLFTAVHIVGRGPQLFSWGVFFPSLVFGYFRDRQDTVVGATVLHIAFNAAFFYPVLFR